MKSLAQIHVNAIHKVYVIDGSLADIDPFQRHEMGYRSLSWTGFDLAIYFTRDNLRNVKCLP